jgi:pimeloyl-ACP methyl ester carboxylesterase
MLRFRRAGRGPPVIFLHGFLGGSGVWAAQQEALADSFDTIAVDLPGFAGSPIESGPGDMRGFVGEIMILADRLGLERFSLVGWSFGGMIAQQAAIDHQERIERLVLCGTAAVGELPRRFESWSRTLARIETDGVAATTERTVRTWFVAGEADPFFSTCRQACDGASEAACRGAIGAMQPWASFDALERLHAPALVITGDSDRSATPADAMALWQRMPSAALCVLPRRAHGLHMEAPDLFNAIAGDFLSGKRRRTGGS